MLEGIVMLVFVFLTGGFLSEVSAPDTIEVTEVIEDAWTIEVISGNHNIIVNCANRHKAESYVSRRDNIHHFYYTIYHNGEVYDSNIDNTTNTTYNPHEYNEYLTTRATASYTKQQPYEISVDLPRLAPMSNEWFADFIANNDINQQPYIPEIYDCDDYAKDFEEAIENAGGDAGIVFSYDRNHGHARNFINIDGEYFVFDAHSERLLSIQMVSGVFDFYYEITEAEADEIWGSGIDLAVFFADFSDIDYILDR